MFQNPVGLPSKKRRLQGACDSCRSKKVRCDSATMVGNVCSNCIAFGTECTHTLGKRGKPSTVQPAVPDPTPDPWQRSETSERTTVNFPTDEVARIHAVLRDPTAIASNEVRSSLSGYITFLEQQLGSQRPVQSEQPRTAYDIATQTSQGPDGMLADQLKIMSVESPDSSRLRFYGKSSSIMLIKSALDFRRGTLSQFHASRRPEFWEIYPWQTPDEKSRPLLEFPEPDLMRDLIELFFRQVNIYYPILHRPTFEKSIQEGLHNHNHHFGALLCVVCALASRYSSDPRVSRDPMHPDQSCGWQWFEQVQPVQPTSLVYPPSIYELQYYCVSALYLHGTSTSESNWVIVGLAVRLAQDIGLHRRLGKKLTAEREAWKRVFWVIAAWDVLNSVYLGRPQAIQSEDFDQDFPIECDDEYWDVSDADAFKQPPNQPSVISYWNSFLKLLGILGMAQRSVYSIKKSAQYNEAAAKLDDALNKWHEHVPEHLRWGEQQDNPTFFNQSASLYTTYYYVRILVHRPCALCPQPLSLAICVKAARRCIDVMTTQATKGLIFLPHINVSLFTSAVVLVLDSWVTPAESVRDNEYVEKCLSILHHYEKRWQIAGRLSDLIEGLLRLDVPESREKPSKRKREPQDPEPSLTSDEYSSFSDFDHTSSFPAATASGPWFPLFESNFVQGQSSQDPHDQHAASAGWNFSLEGNSGETGYPRYESGPSFGPWYPNQF